MTDQQVAQVAVVLIAHFGDRIGHAMRFTTVQANRSLDGRDKPGFMLWKRIAVALVRLQVVA
jgi:hypothetical protein